MSPRGGILEQLEQRLVAVEERNAALAAQVAALREERDQAGRWLTPAEVRALRRCGQTRVWRALESGELPSEVRPWRGGKQCRLIRAEDARAWDPRATGAR